MKRKLKGFSLLEALVALGIASGVLVGFYQSISTGFNLRDRARSVLASELLAARVLDRVGVDIPLHRSHERTGSEGDLIWALKISPTAPPGLDMPGSTGHKLRYITITIAHQDIPANNLRLIAVRYLGLSL